MAEIIEVAIKVACFAALLGAFWWGYREWGSDRPSEPTTPPLPDDPEEGRDFFPEGHRVIEQRRVGEVTLTLCERVRVSGIRAKGWERVVFMHPLPAPLEDARIGRALLEWGADQ